MKIIELKKCQEFFKLAELGFKSSLYTVKEKLCKTGKQKLCRLKQKNKRLAKKNQSFNDWLSIIKSYI